MVYSFDSPTFKQMDRRLNTLSTDIIDEHDMVDFLND